MTSPNIPQHILAMMKALGLDPKDFLVVSLDSEDEGPTYTYVKHSRFCCMDDATANLALNDIILEEDHHEALRETLVNIMKKVATDGMPFCGHDAGLVALAITMHGIARFSKTLGALAYFLAFDTAEGDGRSDEARARAGAFVDDMAMLFSLHLEEGLVDADKRCTDKDSGVTDMMDIILDQGSKYCPNNDILATKVLNAIRALRNIEQPKVH